MSSGENKAQVFRTPEGFTRALGRNTAATVRSWDRLVVGLPVAPRVMRGVIPDESPLIRRFYHSSFLSQRHRGTCVGHNTASVLMTRMRIPPDATATTGEPLPLVRLSPLYTYDISRMEAQKEGINLGNNPGPQGDGSIGSCAIKASHDLGCVRLEDYDSSPQAIDNHRNGTIPPPQVQNTGKLHIVKEFAICDSFEHGLEMLGAGFTVNFCSDIPESMMHVDSKGFFRMRGNIAGGHCYSVLDYSKKLDLAWVPQAWEYWGEQTTNPAYSEMHGYTQIGTCPLSELAKFFTPQLISNGSSEIYVANSVQGWQPAIIDYSVM
jgi:hypothetical protein